MKKIVDSLTIKGNVFPSNELIVHLLIGLDDSYESLVTNILTSLEKEQLNVEEVCLVMKLDWRWVKEKKKGKNYSKFGYAI